MATPTRRPSPSPAVSLQLRPTDHPLDWTCRPAAQRKPSPPARGRARPARRLQRSVRAEGQQSRNQGHSTALGSRPRPACCRDLGGSVRRMEPSPQGTTPTLRPSSRVGSITSRRPGSPCLGGSGCQPLRGLPTGRSQPQGLPHGGGRPRLGTTAPWWTGQGWHCPHSEGVQRPIVRLAKGDHARRGEGFPAPDSREKGRCALIPLLLTRC